MISGHSMIHFPSNFIFVLFCTHKNVETHQNLILLLKREKVYQISEKKNKMKLHANFANPHQLKNKKYLSSIKFTNIELL